MESLQSTSIIETPHAKINKSSRNSVSYASGDSGYLTLTPNSTSFTSVNLLKSQGSYASSKRLRIRNEPWNSGRFLRHRSKLNHLLDVSEVEFVNAESSRQETSISEESGLGKEQSQDFSCYNGKKSVLGQDSFLSEESEKKKNCNCLFLHSEKQNVSSEYFEFGMELRSRTRGNWRTTEPIAPASIKTKILFSPASPTVPSSSYIASEPINEDVEMKLIVPHSTPQIKISPPSDPSSPTTIFSPTSRKRIPVITSVENKKLSRLKITDLVTANNIKPKKLDFSPKACPVKLYRTRATPDYTGKKTCDLLSLLGEKSNHWRIVSKIFSYLEAEDLCSISMVSKSWERICASDSRANMRRLRFIMLKKTTKENLQIARQLKMENDIPSSPKSRYFKKGHLLEVQNLLQTQRHAWPTSSPPVSPSKVKFHSFVKASRTLEPGEQLLPCPRCSFPCHMNVEKNLGNCSRQGCSIEFCASCSSRPHTGPCKTPLLATPTKRNKRIIVGSRQSKRNLRRL
ncbi:uncharacterized protein [Prorops nasuta]|uniref:uncharacterized protein n=1 Tax=Prorops nasuta TaxID=863751 RepID=UPI0034CFF8E1